MNPRRLRSGDLIECSGSRQHFLGRYLKWHGEYICDGCIHQDGSPIDATSRIEYGNPARAVWVADGTKRVLQELQMSKLDETLTLLRDRGVRSASFHASGELASVEFAPDESTFEPTGASVESQHDTQKPAARSPMKASRAVGGLVERAPEQR